MDWSLGEAYLEADVPSNEIISKNSYRSCVVSPELLAVRTSVAGSVMPLYHRPLLPRSLERDVRLRRWNHHLLYVVASIDLEDDSHGVVLGYGVDGILNREEVAGAVRFHDYHSLSGRGKLLAVMVVVAVSGVEVAA